MSGKLCDFKTQGFPLFDKKISLNFPQFLLITSWFKKGQKPILHGVLLIFAGLLKL